MKANLCAVSVGFVFLCFVGCQVPGSDPCNGQQCCEVSCSGNGAGPWCGACMDSCTYPSIGPTDSSNCAQNSALRKAEKPLLGQRVSLPNDGKDAVLLFTSSSCRFAAADMKFHAALYKSAVQARIPFYVVVAQRSEEVFFKSKAEFTDAPVLLGSELSLRVKGTPTIIVVRNGQVETAWGGERATDTQRQNILRSIISSSVSPL